MGIIKRIKKKIKFFEKSIKEIKKQNEKLLKQNKKLIEQSKALKNQNRKIIQHNKWIEEVMAIASIGKVDISYAVGIHAELLSKKEVSIQTHIAYRTWQLTDEEYEDLLKEVKKREHRIKEKHNQTAQLICEREGIEKEEAEKRRTALAKKGISTSAIFYRSLYKLNLNEIETIEKKEKEVIPFWARQAIKRMTDYEKEILGNEWKVSEGKFFLEELKCQNLCDSWRGEFSRYKLWNVGSQEKRDYLLYCDRQYMLYKYCDFAYSYKFLSNKINFNTKLKEIIHRRWFTVKDISYDQFLANIQGLKEIIVKPVEGTLQGDGIEKFFVNQDDESNKKVYEQIVSRSDEVLVEECLKNHPDIDRIHSGTLNTIRLITMIYDGAVDIVCGVIKFGTGNVVDNMHKGGVAAGIDVKTGIVCTEAVDVDGVIHKTHSVSGERILGIQLPCWDDVINTCKKAALVLKDNPLVGWDIAVTDQNQVEIIEGNHNPDFSLIQRPYAISNNEGIKYMFEKYLENYR